jgi:NAD(P)H-dependent FMN reductase
MITILAGTCREGANTLHIARAAEAAYAELGETVSLLNLEDLPAGVVSPGVYGSKPEALEKDFTSKVLAADGLLVVVPEYNGSFPGILKHFIDLLPFPESFDGRPVAFIGLSAGANGALRPVEQLQMVFAYRNAFLFNRRVFIPAVYKVLDEDGKVIEAEIADRIRQQAREFTRFVKALAVLRD